MVLNSSRLILFWQLVKPKKGDRSLFPCIILVITNDPSSPAWAVYLLHSGVGRAPQLTDALKLHTLFFFSWKNHTHKTKEKFSEKSECFNIFCKYHFCLAWKKTEQCSYLIFINNLLWHAILVELYQEIWLYTEIYLEKWQITDPMKEVRKAKESSHHTWEPLFLKIIEKVYIKIL